MNAESNSDMNDLREEHRRVRRNLSVWRWAALGLFISLGVMVVLYLEKPKYELQSARFAVEKKAATILYGKCISAPPDTNYVRLDVTLAGSDISLRSFEWNKFEYASGNRCFKNNQGQTVISMSNFMPCKKEDTIASFDAVIRTSKLDNPFAFNLKVFDLNNHLIGKYPDSPDVYRDTMHALSQPAVILQNVKLIR